MAGEAAIRRAPPTRNSASAEDAFANAPSNLRAELLHGTVLMAPAPAPLHQVHVAELLRRLSGYDRRGRGPTDPGGWLIVPDPEVDLGEAPDKFRPDVAGWRFERATFSLREPAITVAPDWVCEVLSPSTETIDRAIKAPLYASYGVEWLWLIDPEDCSIEVFHNDRGTFRPTHTFRASSAGSLPPFEGAPMSQFFDL